MGLPETDSDEFRRYTHYDPISINSPKTFNPIIWWNNYKVLFSTLYLYTFDTLSLLIISIECERVFNNIKKLISAERNRLRKEIIEVSEYLKNWWDYGLII
jgi:hypothetical protein